MMPDYLSPLWKLLAAQAADTEIQKSGQQIAKELDANLTEISRQKRILDEILSWKAPIAKAWEDLAEVTVGDPFKDAVHRILKETVAEGTRKVSTSLVYRKMTKEGIQNSRRNPKTAIGNIIIQTPGWKKITVGVYEFQGLSGNKVNSGNQS